MAEGLYFYKLQSEYPEDSTLNCKLSINQIDSNFKVLKNYDIKSAEFNRETKTLLLTRNNSGETIDEKLLVVLDDVPYDLNISSSTSDSGVSLYVYYDGKDGVREFEINNLITLEMLRSKIEELIGTDILTKVITDGTLKGDGTLTSPLGLNGLERTGMYAPVIAKIDLTNGGKLPEDVALGTRYATIEYVNDYGYLYNGDGLNKISEKIEEEGRGWRIPSKGDWDALLNAIEPCRYQNHDSARCHAELGKIAGKKLKSTCGWVGQEACECAQTAPIINCAYDSDSNYDDSSNDGEFVDLDEINVEPAEKKERCSGVDKFGMKILPSGIVIPDSYGRPQASFFGEKTIMWTNSHVYGDEAQDKYVKVFDWNKCGVIQEAECPEPYYSVRLVKDYDGKNHFETEYIDGVPYKTILFPQIGQIWLATNYAKEEGFTEAGAGVEKPEFAKVNNGEIIEKRKAVFINEWNGCHWDKKQLKEGDTIVVEEPADDEEIKQYNLEYRVYTTGGSSTQESCNQDLVNTDYITIERILSYINPIISAETEERKEEDEKLWDALSAETEARISAETEILSALSAETIARESADEEILSALTEEESARISADEEIWDALSGVTDAIEEEVNRATERENAIENALNEEIDRATERENEIEGALNEEIARATERENEIEGALNREIARAEEEEGKILDSTQTYVLNAVKVDMEQPYNLILESQDGKPEHFINIEFDADFGEI